MKKSIAAVLLATMAAFPVLYINGRAAGLPSDEEYLYEDIPLVQEGYSYYIRPIARGNGYVAMLPLSAVLYEYADISYDEGNSVVSVTCGTLDVTFWIGETTYIINGEHAELDAPPEIIDGLTYVPSTFFKKTFGFWITGDGDGFIDLFLPSFIIDNI